MSTKAEILARMAVTGAVSSQIISVPDVPEWGEVFIRRPTVGEVDAEIEQKAPEGATKDDRPRNIARGAARLLCDSEGNRLFDPGNPADLDFLAAQPWSILQKVVAAGKEPGTDDEGN